jgi:hypothetical protein
VRRLSCLALLPPLPGIAGAGYRLAHACNNTP